MFELMVGGDTIHYDREGATFWMTPTRCLQSLPTAFPSFTNVLQSRFLFLFCKTIAILGPLCFHTPWKAFSREYDQFSM